MEILPLIKIRNRKIIKEHSSVFNKDLEENKEKKRIYILDLDGIEKNKPNFCTYQRLSKFYEVWTDFAPKNLGDVVDAFMSGVNAIVIRKRCYKNFNPKKIREISDNNIFLNIEDEEQENLSLYKKEINGYVNFKTREEVESNQKLNRLIRKLQNDMYSYEKNHDNKEYWKRQEIKGLIIEINKLERFK